MDRNLGAPTRTQKEKATKCGKGRLKCASRPVWASERGYGLLRGRRDTAIMAATLAARPQRGGGTVASAATASAASQAARPAPADARAPAAFARRQKRPAARGTK